MKEVWREHKSGLLVSNMGQVFVPGGGRKYPNGHYTYGSLRPDDYFYISYNKIHHLVHDLVVEAFYNIELNGLHVHHINGNEKDNRLENLVALSEEEHRKMHGKGSKSVLQYDLNGNFIKEWSSVSEVQRQLGFAKGNIVKCCKGKHKQAYGYIWKYKTE